MPPANDDLDALADLAMSLRMMVETGQPAAIVTATAADLARRALTIARAVEKNAAALEEGRG